VDSGPLVAYGKAIVSEIEEDRVPPPLGGKDKIYQSFKDDKGRPIIFEVWKKG
jgi:hypothetical protein